jgi:hypothetical protein
MIVVMEHVYALIFLTPPPQILNISLGCSIIILLYYQLTPCVLQQKKNIDDVNGGGSPTNLHLHVSPINPVVVFFIFAASPFQEHPTPDPSRATQ